MASKTATPVKEHIGRVGQRRQVVIPREMLEIFDLQEGDFVAFKRQSDGVLIKPKRVVDPDDVLSREEGALITRARREMREGKSKMTLAQAEHELAHKRPSRRRKTA